MAKTEINHNTRLGTIAAAADDTIGGRPYMQDRSEVLSIKTSGGINLLLALVADGMGGGNDGEVAAEKTKDAILAACENSKSTDVSEILRGAIEAANRAVTGDESLYNAGSTATVVAIHENRLYLAHVGDSRVYLIRQNRLIQLTEDHTWGNEMLKENKLSIEEVNRISRSGNLSRFVGKSHEIKVDQNIQSVPNKGYLELQAGDGVILCSDGLIKNRPDSTRPFVQDSEIVRAFSKENPAGAVGTLISLAKGRRVDDNVSVVVIKVPGGKAISPVLLRSLLVICALGILGLILFIPTLLGISLPTRPSPTVTTMVIDIPDVPENSAVVDNVHGNVWYQISEQPANELTNGENIPLASGVFVRTTVGTARIVVSDQIVLYIGEQSEIMFSDFDQGSDVLILMLNRGRILTDVSLVQPDRLIVQTPLDAQASVSRGLMGVAYETALDVDCLIGKCQITSDADGRALQMGESSRYFDGIFEPAHAQYDLWQVFAPPVPTLTPLPSATSTHTPTVTPTSTSTPMPTVIMPPTLAPTEKEVEPPPVSTSTPTESPSDTPEPPPPPPPPPEQPPAHP